MSMLDIDLKDLVISLLSNGSPFQPGGVTMYFDQSPGNFEQTLHLVSNDYKYVIEECSHGRNYWVTIYDTPHPIPCETLPYTAEGFNTVEETVAFLKDCIERSWNDGRL